ncbi:hypothetical protein [Kocuria sp. NPDC057446]|uniref:antitoxin VbhA family protein n=1 Tax=Kocuria sp. NPDC057446 TaxID=3346137 RepID=UPI0036B44187
MAHQPTRPPLVPHDRVWQVAAATHSAAMEGLQVTEATRADMERFADGQLEVEELLRRTRARHEIG